MGRSFCLFVNKDRVNCSISGVYKYTQSGSVRLSAPWNVLVSGTSGAQIAATPPTIFGLARPFGSPDNLEIILGLGAKTEWGLCRIGSSDFVELRLGSAVSGAGFQD